MGKIKKILENELLGGTQSTDVYPVTSTKAVYNENNESLDDIINKKIETDRIANGAVTTEKLDSELSNAIQTNTDAINQLFDLVRGP